jgi:hypothetical protein
MQDVLHAEAGDERWLAKPIATQVAFVLPLLVALASLRLGFVTDDYGFRAQLHSKSPFAPKAYDLFRFATGAGPWHDRAVEAGALPWWSAPDLKIHFLRPMTSLLFALDDALFGDHAILYHLHSIAWFVALLFAARSLFRRLLPSDGVPIALVVFGLAHANVAGYAWPSARHVVVGATLGIAAVAAHLGAQDVSPPSEGRRWPVTAVALLVLGLLASETALGAVVLWIALDLVGVADGETSAPWQRRISRCAPALVSAGLYLGVYRLAGGGAHSSGGYHDPFGEPLAFLGVAIARVPELLGDGLASVPVETAMLWPMARCITIGLVATALVVVAIVQVRKRASPSERRALLAVMIAVVPMLVLGATGFPSSRVLVVPNVAFAILVAVVVRIALLAPRNTGEGSTLAIVVAWAVVFAHLVLSPLSSLRDVRKMAERARATERNADVIATESGASRRVVIVAASDPYVFLYPHGVLAEREPATPRCWSVLSAARSGHTIRRVDDTTLALVADDRPLLDGTFDSLFRASDRPFAVGDSFRQCGLTIRVTEERGGLPVAVEVTFERSVDAVAASLFVFRDHALVPFVPPAVGESTTLRWSSGPSGVL